jgi:hypothetical protein
MQLDWINVSDDVINLLLENISNQLINHIKGNDILCPAKLKFRGGNVEG